MELTNARLFSFPGQISVTPPGLQCMMHGWFASPRLAPTSPSWPLSGPKNRNIAGPRSKKHNFTPYNACYHAAQHRVNYVYHPRHLVSGAERLLFLLRNLTSSVSFAFHGLAVFMQNIHLAPCLTSHSTRWGRLAFQNPSLSWHKKKLLGSFRIIFGRTPHQVYYPSDF